VFFLVKDNLQHMRRAQPLPVPKKIRTFALEIKVVLTWESTSIIGSAGASSRSVHELWLTNHLLADPD